MSEEKCTFFKKRSRQAVRQKAASSSSEEESVEVHKKPKRRNVNILHQQTANFHKNAQGLPDDPDDEHDQNGTEKSILAYKASNSTTSQISKEHSATAALEIDTDPSLDAQALFETARKMNKAQKASDKGVYRGINNYVQYVEKKDTVMGNASSGFNRKGPMRAPSNLRATVRWDYQPDICKDYKETGFCGFGDSCKFLHDRSDYKHGWQIDQELAEGTFGVDCSDNRYEIIHHSSEEELDMDIPWVCLLCRKDYKDPIVTKCGHYFCSDCALKRYKKTARCYACTADTKGSFKFAKDLQSRIKAMRSKQKRKPEDTGCCSDVGELESDEAASPHGTSVPCESSREVQSERINLQNEQSSATSHPQPRLPVPAEPNWAEPEAIQYCDTDEESD